MSTANASAELASVRERQQTLLSVAESIAACREPEELFRRLAGELQRVVRFENIGLLLYDAERDVLRPQILETSGMILSPPRTDVTIQDNPTRWVMDSQEPLIIPDTSAETRWPETIRRIRDEGVMSFCLLPLTTPRRRLGAIGFGRRERVNDKAADVEFLSQVAKLVAMAVENALAFREIAQLKDKLAEERLYLETEIRSEHLFEDVIGDSPALRHALQQVEVVAGTDSTVLLLGETGTGKELIARAIHDRSYRRERTLVKINCAAIPSGLLESELFGHERGAFTGAIAQKVGRFEVADRGTLFLDEVGEIPLELQTKLLRVLQEQEFERIGSTRTIKVDVRLIAATNRDLRAMVEEHRFRDDLYYRLNVFPIRLPALRERPEDVPALVRYFVQKLARPMGRQVEVIPRRALDALQRYPWPGNVRELANFVERAIVLSPGRSLEVPLNELKSRHAPLTQTEREAMTLRGAERAHILRALEDTGWVLGGPRGAAARLGVKRTTLQYRMRRLGISRER